MKAYKCDICGVCFEHLNESNEEIHVATVRLDLCEKCQHNLNCFIKGKKKEKKSKHYKVVWTDDMRKAAGERMKKRFKEGKMKRYKRAQPQTMVDPEKDNAMMEKWKHDLE